MVNEESALILLDEPDSGLDDAAVEQLVNHIHMLRNLGHAIVIATHDKRLLECATALHDLSKSTEQEPTNNEIWQVNTTDNNYPFLRTKNRLENELKHLGIRTEKLVSSTTCYGRITLIVDPLTISENDTLLMGFALAPAFTMGLVETHYSRYSVNKNRYIGGERRATEYRIHISKVSWSGLIFTTIAMQIFIQSVDFEIVIAGGLITLSTSFTVRFLQMSTIRLARSNAVFVRLLTQSSSYRGESLSIIVRNYNLQLQ